METDQIENDINGDRNRFHRTNEKIDIAHLGF